MNFLNDAQGIDLGFRQFRRKRVLAMSLATTMAILFGGAGLASAQGTCPASGALKNFRVASNVGAFFSTDGQKVTTYTFVSLTNENPVGGVPGLIKYCVYPSPASQPTNLGPQATGADGTIWTIATGSKNFAFARPAGNPSNIPLDGQITVMGTATWPTPAPSVQTILLHISDAAVCASIYGSDSSGTCFVKPTNLAQVCNAGNSGVAYNAMPYGVVDCPKPSLGFEATSTNEFGDEVELAGTARQLVSLSVLFASFACESGHWNTNDCTTTPGHTFTHSITGNIYSVKDCMGTPCPDGPPLATMTQTFTIPYRPSKDAVNCTGGDAGKWFNAVSGLCQNSISTVLTFDFGQTPLPDLPDQVIWTVAFNTTNAGYNPVGPAIPACGPGGCPYDSLNVGAQTFSGAPYAGTDVDADQAFRSVGPGGLLAAELGWIAFKPLGRITTKP
jgi:hypothetical protein